MTVDPGGVGPGAPRRTVLVGCGKLGLRLSTLLMADGGEVVALRRDASGLPASVRAVEADLTAPLAQSLPAADAMVITLPPSVDPRGYPVVLRHLRDALPSTPPRTVFVSSTGVFEGWDGRQPITEADVPRPRSERARRIHDGELAAIDLFDAVVIRPAGIYGPGRHFLVRTVRDARPVNPRTRTNRIHESDLVRALDLLVRGGTVPDVLHAVDAAPAPLGDVTGFIAGLMGVEPPPDGGEEGGPGNVFDGRLLRDFLGGLDYPSYREGYREMLEKQ
ncbi:hypothetical protein [Demequina sp. NBRC 110057]|uniref:hypothetical protein n=1 Tax=Demequina sp. NBRC 110057 TaxID=1570346 RepID=UPI001F3F90FE|nr:hypothetical protein [Demequina sp. NBRC 110057]